MIKISREFYFLTMTIEQDEIYYMKQALELAKQAYSSNEVPVGAIIVKDNTIIGKGFNSVIRFSDPTAHAEIVALREAGKTVGNYRILDADLYVTLEPCLMCFSAMIHARIRNLYFGAFDYKSGIFSTDKYNFVKNIFNHQISIKSGIILEDSLKLMQDFFKERRGAGAAERGGLENR